MKKTVEPNESYSLLNISRSEMELMQNAFILLVRETANEEATNILKVLRDSCGEVALSKKKIKRDTKVFQ